MGDPVFHVCLGSRIRAHLFETREIYVILYHHGTSPLRGQRMKDSLFNESIFIMRRKWGRSSRVRTDACRKRQEYDVIRVTCVISIH